MKNVLLSWRGFAMDEKKFEIKYRVARNTEKEIEKIQKGFSIIHKNKLTIFIYRIWISNKKFGKCSSREIIGSQERRGGS